MTVVFLVSPFFYTILQLIDRQINPPQQHKRTFLLLYKMILFGAAQYIYRGERRERGEITLPKASAVSAMNVRFAINQIRPWRSEQHLGVRILSVCLRHD